MIHREEFLAHIEFLAAQLPEHQFVVNLCRDRYLFTVAVLAAMKCSQTTLLPPAHLPAVVAHLCEDYPDIYGVADESLTGFGLDLRMVDLPPAASPGSNVPVADVDGAWPAVMFFTSGSTGRPQPSSKCWGALRGGANLAAQRLGLDTHGGGTLIASIPPQHMFGFEMGVALPLFSGNCIHAGLPLFPGSIRQTLASVPGPRRLFTTPTHLRACVKLDIAWPEIDFVVSATAPLSEALAARAEVAFRAPVLEFYGCTETGVIASRRTMDGPRWRWCDGVSAAMHDGVTEVVAPHLRRSVALGDRLTLHALDEFEFHGRHDDMVKVAGHRTVLSDLNIKLNEVEGVEDGIFVMPDGGQNGKPQRLAALVVAPGVGKQQIMDSLATKIHSAFLPRPLHKVERLPRNSIGKLPRAVLLETITALSRDAASQ